MFLKIFLSFWLIVGLFAAAQEIAARLAHAEEQRTLAPVHAIIDDGRAIEAAYDQRGRSGAADAADAFERRRGLFADLLDAQRRSITGRPVRPAEIQVARLAERIAAAGQSEVAVNGGEALAAQQMATSGGERVTLVVGLPHSVTTIVSRALLISSPVRLLLILSIGGLVCFAVARHLTRPIVDLSLAAEGLAEGRLSTRVGESARKRRDELGSLARDFDRMAERVEALVAGQRRLLGDVSHELRSPLARLTVALSLAQQRSNEEEATYLARIEREAGRLDQLIEQLLMLARVESGVDNGLRGRFDLTELVQEVVGDGDFEARASGKRVTLLACDPAAMVGISELMRSAIENIVRNAIRYTAAGSSVAVTLHATGLTSAQVSVRDHGPGIGNALASEMFKPFWRAPADADVPSEGAGLGLAIADRVVRMHEGRVSAANAPDGGLVVTVELPLAS